MNFYEEAASDADELLAEFGQRVTIKRITSGDYDPATSAASIATTLQMGTAVILDFGIKDIDGTLIKTGDKRMLLSAIGITPPQVDDIVMFGASTCQIKNTNPLDPAGIIVFYDVHLRGV
ncbi:hypothetical protein ACO0LB_10000 [Undibacterium sp. SXout7W]|uniref:hypothetical protein n=1 Tax=Undibacterium sp. SXout7W TaxID=3413049 RepID=UPI003BF23252